MRCISRVTIDGLKLTPQLCQENCIIHSRLISPKPIDTIVILRISDWKVETIFKLRITIIVAHTKIMFVVWHWIHIIIRLVKDFRLKLLRCKPVRSILGCMK